MFAAVHESGWGKEETHAPQQTTLLFDHLVGSRLSVECPRPASAARLISSTVHDDCPEAAAKGESNKQSYIFKHSFQSSPASHAAKSLNAIIVQ
jgi:hypothetical protein